MYNALFIDRILLSNLHVATWKPQWFHLNPVIPILDYSMKSVGYCHSHLTKRGGRVYLVTCKFTGNKNKTLYVHDVPPETSEEILRVMFPDVSSVNLPVDKEGKKLG